MEHSRPSPTGRAGTTGRRQSTARWPRAWKTGSTWSTAPLAGFGRGAIDHLVEERLDVESGPSESVPKADYETELRALMADEYGESAVDDVFPEHTQSRVVGLR